MRMFKPVSLHEAYCLAKLQEVTLASTKRSKPILEKPPTLTRTFSAYRESMGGSSGSTYHRQSGRSISVRGPYAAGSTNSSVGSVSSKPRRVLAPKELDDKRANNLCFFCDEKYFPGRKCVIQVYGLEVLEREDGVDNQEGSAEEDLSQEVTE